MMPKPAAPATSPDPSSRLIVALDVQDVAAAERLAERLADCDAVLKIGHQLAYTGGLGLAERLIRAGRSVFLDLKLHDIPRTVEEGVRSLAGFGATFLTIHAYPQTMRAAMAGRGTSGLKLLAVTVLTSMDDSDAQAAGYGRGVADLVSARAADAQAAGIDGLVCAAPEITALRRIIAPTTALVVPGIRPTGAAVGDQKRVATPGEAIAAGADYLVVGRPITGAADPLAAALAIAAEIAAAASPA
jgi:orotidine-5'-phosphate decarboxylase